MEVQSIAKQNKGFRYILVIIDEFFKYAWAQPIKKKTDCEWRRIHLRNDGTQHWKWSERHGRVSPFSGCYRLSVQK